MVKRVAIIAAAVLSMVVAAWGAAAWLRPPLGADRYTVLDADTLAVQPQHCRLSRLAIACPSQRLRLDGVDAFDSTQTCRDAGGQVWRCGAVATERLRQLVAEPDFFCVVDPEFVDRHGRQFASCSAAGRDVGALLVSEGLAFAYGRGERYLPLESEAKREERGAWAGSFMRPQFFREGAVE